MNFRSFFTLLFEDLSSTNPYTRHAELEAKYHEGTITPEEMQEAQKLVDEAAKRAGLKTKEDLFSIGDIQRGIPESKMLKAQKALGGGVMSVMIEHMGDLTHRMADRNTFDTAGYMYVLEKVDRGLKYLWSTNGFQKEHHENMKSNARYRGIEIEEHYNNVFHALQEYQKAHSQIPTFNHAQELAKKAAISTSIGDTLGLSHARTALQKLKDHLGSAKDWVAFAHEGVGDTRPFTGTPLAQRFDPQSNNIKESQTPI